MEEVTEVYQDPLAFLKNLGLNLQLVVTLLEKFMNNNIHKKQIHTNLKVKEISGSNWDMNLMDYSKLKSLFDERMVKSKLIE